MLPLQVLVSIDLYVDEEGLLDNIVCGAKETQVESTRAEELGDLHVGLRDTVNIFDASLFVEIEVAARCHSDIEHFAVFVASHNDIFEVNGASSGLEGFCRVLRELLLRRNRHCEIEIVDVLAHFDRLLKVTFFDVGAKNGDLNPLCLIEP